MKKYLSFVLVAIVICTYCTSISAQNQNYIYTIDNTTVIFDANSIFSTQEQKYIANLLVRSDSDSESYALLCVISGHAYGQGESITTITHRVDEIDPRCFQERFIISKCTRCEHYQTESLGGHYISCCPED